MYAAKNPNPAPMAPEEFVEAMRAICQGGDPIMEELEGGALLCKTLEALGYGEGVRVFDDATNKYA